MAARISSPRRPPACPPTPRMRSSSLREEGLRLAISTSVASPSTLWTGPVVARRGLLPPAAELPCDRALVGAEGADPRQAREDRPRGRARRWSARSGSHSSCAHASRPAAVSRRSSSAASSSRCTTSSLAYPTCSCRERPGVPAREAGALCDPDAEGLGEERLVGALGAHSREPGGDLRVEDVRDLGPEPAADQGDVLAARVHHDLDRGIGEHGREL